MSKRQRPFSPRPVLSTCIGSSSDSVSSRHPLPARQNLPNVSMFLAAHSSLGGCLDPDVPVSLKKVLPDYDYFSSLHDTQRTDSAQDSCEFVFEMCFKSIDRKSHALQNPTLPPHCRSVPAPKVEEQADLLLGWVYLHQEEQQLEDHHGQPQCSPGGQALPHLGQEGWRPIGLTEIWKVPWILSDLIMFRSFQSINSSGKLFKIRTFPSSRGFLWASITSSAMDPPRKAKRFASFSSHAYDWKYSDFLQACMDELMSVIACLGKFDQNQVFLGKLTLV